VTSAARCTKATGYKGDQDPAFCYRITVRNCGNVPLSQLSVVDNHLGDLTSQFFPARPSWIQSVRDPLFQHGLELQHDQHRGGLRPECGADGKVVTDRDSAIAVVKKAKLSCDLDIKSPADKDCKPYDNHVLLPSDGGPHPVTFKLKVCNTGYADLVDVSSASRRWKPQAAAP